MDEADVAAFGPAFVREVLSSDSVQRPPFYVQVACVSLCSGGLRQHEGQSEGCVSLYMPTRVQFGHLMNALTARNPNTNLAGVCERC